MTVQTSPGQTSPGPRTAREIACVERPASVADVDQARYFEANPDVARSGQSAAEHFARHGQAEGRIQYVNAAQVAAMRDAKLARLRFRRAPRVPRAPGRPIDFLTAGVVAEFDIPDAPPVSANQYGGPFIEEIAAHPERLCLDVGAGLRYGYAENVVNTEIYASISTDVLCVGEDMPFEDAQFDYVICAAVLEHTRRPWDVAREICRVLRPGGRILIDWPFLQGVHGYPHHYYNATPQGLISLFDECCDIVSSTIEPNNHPMHGIWWVLRAWRLGLPEPEQRAFDALTIGGLLAAPVERHLGEPYCTAISQEMLRTIPAGSTLIARRKEGHGTAGEADAVDPGNPARQGDAARIAALEDEVALLRTSRSWRLTAPLRAIGRGLGRR